MSDSETRRRQDSSMSFSEGIFQSRQRSQRLEPWFQALPVRRVIPTIYRGLYSSKHLQPFQLVSLGKTVLKFLREQIDMSNNMTVLSALDWEHQNYLQIFDAIFSRLLTMTFEEGDSFQELLDSVWDLHRNGIIDFSSTTIPEKLVETCPNILREVLKSCLSAERSSNIDLSDASPIPLVPLCEQSPENFMMVMEFLQIKFATAMDPVIREKITDFALRFVNLLKSKRGKDCNSLYPTPFQPLLNFILVLSVQNNNKKLFNNPFVMEEVCSLIDIFYYQSELMKLDISIITFMLCTVPKVSDILKQQQSDGMISYCRFPCLRRMMRTEEFVQSFDI